MTWNWRVVKTAYQEYEGAEPDFLYEIHEVYYNDDGKPDLVTSSAVSPCGGTRDELISDFTNMLGAFLKPTLNFEDF